MSDRELLEMAAKATGDFYQHPSHEIPENLPVAFYLNEKRWNPLTDDGDALRLAVKLKLSISAANPAFIEVAIFKDGEAHLLFRNGTMDSGWNEDSYAATRRAITRAAAEIGKTMENQNV
jgi:hypothetical protein